MVVGFGICARLCFLFVFYRLHGLRVNIVIVIFIDSGYLFVNSFNVRTGELLWTWSTGSSGLDTPFGNWPLLHIDAIADGKI